MTPKTNELKKNKLKVDRTMEIKGMEYVRNVDKKYSNHTSCNTIHFITLIEFL